MNTALQTLLVLAVVALAATWLVLRLFAKRRNPGCGGDCGCPSSEIKVKSRQKRPVA